MVSDLALLETGSQAHTKHHTLLEIHEDNTVPHGDLASNNREKQQHRPLRERIGMWSIAILVLSTCAALAIIGFLTHIWRYGNNPKSGSGAAYWMAIEGFTVKAVTLSSVVLRLAVAVQAGICTSLAAALLLERNSVPIPDLFYFAATRSINPGPTTLMYPIGRQLRTYLRSLPAVVIVVIFLTTTASQLSSTILVLDLGLEEIESPVAGFNHSFGTDRDSELQARSRAFNIDFWGSRALAYVPFGEIRKVGGRAENMHDTGTTFQGMVPSRDTEVMNRLRGWSTITTVFGSRVACVAPTIDATVQQYTTGEYSYLTGTATFEGVWNDSIHCAGDMQTGCVINFNCSLPSITLSNNENAQANGSSDWIMGICAVGQSTNWTFGPSFFDSVNSSKADGQAATIILPTGLTMVLNHTGTSSVNPDTASTYSNVSKAIRTNQEWATYDLKDRGSVDLSLCFARSESKYRYAKLRSHHRLNPAEVQWDVENWRYDTLAVQRLFGMTDDVSPDIPRDILSMQMPPFDGGIPTASVTQGWEHAELGLYQRSTNETTAGKFLPGCFGCEGSPSISVHPHTSTLFHDIVKGTRHPALGLQTIFNTIAHSAYYEELPTFNVDFPAEIVLTQATQIPGRWVGFSVVVGSVGLHLTMMVLMVYLFATRTKESMLGETWCSMGQVIHQVPERMLIDSAGRTDGEVRRECKKSGLNRVGSGHNRDGEEGGLMERR